MSGRAHNPWDAAAACETHAQSTKDRKLKDKFLRIRDNWIRIANDEQLTGRLGARARTGSEEELAG
jgi:hypothetical protein